MIKGFDTSDAIEAVKNWATDEANDTFDTTFIDSLATALDEYGELTEGQENALSNIVSKFNIDISEHL